MNHFSKKQFNTAEQGFTIIETLVAIFILALCVDAIISLAANGLFSIRYAKNTMVATNLAQESLEYIRNERDTIFSQGGDFQDWEKIFNVNKNGVQQSGNPPVNGCWKKNRGCTIDPYTTTASGHVTECLPTGCPGLTYYPNSHLYAYPTDIIHTYPVNTNGGYLSNINRTVTMELENDPNQVMVTVTVNWVDGTQPKSLSQSMLITNWKI